MAALEGRLKRVPKSARAKRPEPTHLGPKCHWDDQEESEDSDDDANSRNEQSTESESSDEDMPTEARKTGKIGFASKNAAQRQTTGQRPRAFSGLCYGIAVYADLSSAYVGKWSWIPNNFYYDMFETTAVDVTLPRQTRRKARESGTSSGKTAMERLKECAPVYTYQGWTNPEERMEMEKQANRRYDADNSNFLDEGFIDDSADNAGSSKPAFRCILRPRWPAIPAAFEPSVNTSRRSQKQKLPEGADANVRASARSADTAEHLQSLHCLGLQSQQGAR